MDSLQNKTPRAAAPGEPEKQIGNSQIIGGRPPEILSEGKKAELTQSWTLSEIVPFILSGVRANWLRGSEYLPVEGETSTGPG